MEKQEIKSKWDDLARQLGAEVPLEAQQLVEATAPVAADTETAEPDTEVAAPRPQPVKRPAAGWDSLASEFGLPTPPPPVEPVREAEAPARQTDVEPQVAQREERPRREPREHREREERPRRQRTREHREQREQAEPRGRRRQPRRSDRDVESVEPPAAAERSTPRAEETHTPPPTAEPDERSSRGAAVSLWHKIFGSPVDQAAKLSDVSTAHEEWHPTSPAAEEMHSARELDELDEPAVADAGEFEGQDLDQLDAVEAASDDALVTERKRRPRRRRRRRGGTEERSAEKDVRERRRSRARSDRREPEPNEPADDLMADDDELDSDLASVTDTEGGDIDANGESSESVTRSKSTLQRSIPSWDEAIGYIVELNMQSRSQRRQSSHSGSRSHAPRNRTRGRHKK